MNIQQNNESAFSAANSHMKIQRNLNIKEVIDIIDLSRATIYRMMGLYLFPLSVKVSIGKVAWKPVDIEQFIALGPYGWYEKFGKQQEAEKIERQLA